MTHRLAKLVCLLPLLALAACTANPAADCQTILAFSETIAEPSDHLEEHCLNDSDARTMVDSANR